MHESLLSCVSFSNKFLFWDFARVESAISAAEGK